MTLTLVQYYGSNTQSTIEEDGFVNGATEANDRGGSQWTNVPSELSGLTYLLTARDDKSDGLGENEVMYTVNVSAPSTVFLLLDYRVPSWVSMDGWQNTNLTVYGDGETYSVYKKDFTAGDIDLKRLKDGSSQGTSYVFKLSGGPSVEINNVYDINGRRIKSYILTDFDNQIILNRDEFPPGLLIAKFRYGSRTFTKKLMLLK